MRKIALICLLLVVISNKAMAQTIQIDEMLEIADVVAAGNLNVASWQVTIRESMDRKRIDEIVDEMKNGYIVTRSEDENSIKYSISDGHKSAGIVESYMVIIPKDATYNSEFIAVLEGDSWDDNVTEIYLEKVELLQKIYFTKSAKRFACLTTDFDAIIKTDVFLENLTKILKLEHINTQYDTISNSKHKKIIYGYTPLWKQKITIMDEPMNLQIAVLNDESGKVSYAIGTPILINEY